MKRSDWALIVLIVAVVGVAAYFIVNAFVGSPADNLEKVETAIKISPDVIEPSESIFSTNAINPTVKVRIGEAGGQQPFSIGKQ